ncbi:hypothetical protein CCMA1212_004456 [Trichoderma ghanense]|uniref:Uncharacterized protein n=1 Tax=Trichoderma ghanense TaxID=65468 RepID=A0ABY2H710_9HYPO
MGVRPSTGQVHRLNPLHPIFHLIAHSVARSISSRPIITRLQRKKRDRGRHSELGRLKGRCCIHQHPAADGKASQRQARHCTAPLSSSLLAYGRRCFGRDPAFSAPRPSSTRPHAAFLPQPAPVRRRQRPSFEPHSASLQLAFPTRSSLSALLDSSPLSSPLLFHSWRFGAELS